MTPSRRTVLLAAGAGSVALSVAGTGTATAAEPLPPRGPRTGDNPVVRENLAEGSDEWSVGSRETCGVDLRNPQIQAYASAASVTPGETLTLRPASRTGSRTCTVEVYRLGHYGGDRARHLLTAEDVTVGRAWKLKVPGTWVSGLFLAVLTTPEGHRAYTPFVVREPARRSDVLAVVPLSYAGRRPYPGLGMPAAFGADASASRWLEEAGYDVTYATEDDVRARRIDPRRYPAVVHPSAVALPRPLALAEPGHTDERTRREAAELVDGLLR
ncbi:N,N-dimethylformamidase beta subunit family domain-containing protein [Streptomyces sp. NPDC085481]|uniref:N,N-dimethylformamidase beta subunit family domain-containing protein n=1 Tax=Streptomyces sp. NPDC085481 TaxID=3365727 RepID=UPI0037CEF386